MARVPRGVILVEFTGSAKVDSGEELNSRVVYLESMVIAFVV
jgi:hypothetical protein